MAANNQIIIIGRAGKDAAPELRRLQSGESCVVNLSIAVNRPGKETKTDWIQVQFWNQNAERFAQFVKKGNLISVTGSMRIDAWDNNGETRNKAYIHGESFQMLESKSTQKAQDVGYSDFRESKLTAPRSSSPLPKNDYIDEFTLDDDELPPF